MRPTPRRLAALAAAALLAACGGGGADPVQPATPASAAEVAAATAAADPTPYGAVGVSAASWLLPTLPADLALTADQQARIRALTDAYDAATRADREALFAIGRDLAAAQRAGATREQVRALLERTAPVAARLTAASRQLEADVRAVLTPAQLAWLTAQRQRADQCARLAASPEYRARVAEITRAYAAQTAADRAALADVRRGWTRLGGRGRRRRSSTRSSRSRARCWTGSPRPAGRCSTRSRPRRRRSSGHSAACRAGGRASGGGHAGRRAAGPAFAPRAGPGRRPWRPASHRHTENAMASQADIAGALQRAGVTVYGLQVTGNQVSGTVASEDARSKAYSAIAAVDNSANLNIGVNTGFAAQEASAAAAGTQSYTVQSGDTLSKIAKQHYGDAGQWRKIFEANRGTITDPDKIQVGQQLTIPG